MEQTIYLIISISLIIVLAILFVVFFVVNKKTPIPKECMELEIDDEKCANCHNLMCNHNINKEKENQND